MDRVEQELQRMIRTGREAEALGFAGLMDPGVNYWTDRCPEIDYTLVPDRCKGDE